MRDPYQRITDAALATARAELEWMAEEAEGDSPIEKLFSFAMAAQNVCGTSQHRVRFATNPEQAAGMRTIDQLCAQILIIERQADVDGWRVDFLIHVYDFGYPDRPEGWIKLIVECDGHDFHERTKEQAARDRARDRDAQSKGITVFRFTGAELWKDAWGCSNQVMEWASRCAP